MFVCGLSFFDQKKMHALAGRMELLQVCTYLWQDSEFAFECALCILLHLLDGDKSYVSESPQRSRGRCPVKETGMPWSGALKYWQFSDKIEYALVSILRCSIKYTGMPWSGELKYWQFSDKIEYALVSILRCSMQGMPWSGACKYCQFSGKTENWYAFTGAQSKTQVALVRCSISVKELSIMHLITDYLRTH